MKSLFQVITTPTADTPGTALYLQYPDKRYFFGQISEGLQRACVERGTNLSKLNDVFITGRTEWANTGGLIGVILTLADAVASGNAAIEEQNRKKRERLATLPDNGKGQRPAVAQDHQLIKGQLTIHGTTNLSHTLATARRFVFRRGTPLYTKEYNTENIPSQTPTEGDDPFEKPTWFDHNIKVWALPIKPISPTTFEAPTQVRPQSPRKRSLDEFRESDVAESQPGQSDIDLMARQAIVNEMFNSNWNIDALVETPLAEVKMPAAMFVRNPETKDMVPYNGPKPGGDEPLPDIKVFVRKPWPGARVENLPPTSPSKEAICYVVRTHDIRGKFDAAKAKEMNLKSPTHNGLLAKGESVENKDGKIITPDMVLGPTREGAGTAIMDVPSVEYVESLVNRPEWKSPAVTTNLKAFVWILGPGVGDHPKLREFVAKMSHCHHTVSSTDYSPNYLALPSPAKAAIRLAKLKEDSYSIPVHDNVTLPQNRATLPKSTQPIDAQNLPFVPLQPGLIIDLEPKYQMNHEEILENLDAAETVLKMPKSVEQRMSVIGQRVAKPKFQEHLAAVRNNLPGGDAEITALGTGSSSPSKYRNVSATLVYAPGSGYYLLDCGENTLGQLERVFEPEKLREILQNLRMVWISHLHADHHLGTVSLIRAWYRENYGHDAKPVNPPETDLTKIMQEKRLCLISDEMMVAWLEEYASVENFGADKLLSLCTHTNVTKNSLVTKFSYRHKKDGAPPFGLYSEGRTILDFNDDSSPLTPLLKSATGLKDMLATSVKHCKGALAVSLVFPDGFKVSYSGDCRPSDKFALIGKDSTVLIHEATFQDDMVGSALAKRHSTAGEALEVGRRMGARAVLLTHFSQRYAKTARFDQEADTETHGCQLEKKAGIAPQKSADADIPFDDPEDEPAPKEATPNSYYSLLDDIRFPTRNQPALPRRDLPYPQKSAVVATAMDYLRIKVRDIALAQAYAPALEKLIDVIERQSELEAAKVSKKVQEEDEARKEAKRAKFGKKEKGAQGAKGAKGGKGGKDGKAGAKAVAGGAAAAVAVSAETDEQKPATEAEESKTEVEQAKPAAKEEVRDLFEASESEAGWETSDFEA